MIRCDVCRYPGMDQNSWTPDAAQFEQLAFGREEHREDIKKRLSSMTVVWQAVNAMVDHTFPAILEEIKATPVVEVGAKIKRIFLSAQFSAAFAAEEKIEAKYAERLNKATREAADAKAEVERLQDELKRMKDEKALIAEAVKRPKDSAAWADAAPDENDGIDWLIRHSVMMPIGADAKAADGAPSLTSTSESPSMAKGKAVAKLGAKCEAPDDKPTFAGDPSIALPTASADQPTAGTTSAAAKAEAAADAKVAKPADADVTISDTNSPPAAPAATDSDAATAVALATVDRPTQPQRTLFRARRQLRPNKLVP